MKNILFSISSIIFFLLFFFTFLNFIFGGVPLFNLLNIKTSEAVFALRDEKNKPDYEIQFENNYFVDECGKSENGYYNLAFKKDNFGFRENSNNLFYKTDIVILGDSFGISSCVNYPNDLSTKLKEKLDNDNILNISVGGTGPFYQKEMIINLFEKNKTEFKTLIWLFYEGNDHEDLKKNFGKKIDFDFKRSNNDLDIEVKYVSFPNKYWIKIKLIVANFLRGFGTTAKYFNVYPDLLPNKLDYENVVSDMNDFLSKKNIENKIIFYIPKYTRLAHKKIFHPQLKQLDNLKNLVEEISTKYGFEFIDGSKIYHARKNPLNVFHYNLPTHFNIDGYDLLAQELSKILINK